MRWTTWRSNTRPLLPLALRPRPLKTKRATVASSPFAGSLVGLFYFFAGSFGSGFQLAFRPAAFMCPGRAFTVLAVAFRLLAANSRDFRLRVTARLIQGVDIPAFAQRLFLAVAVLLRRFFHTV